MIKKSAAKDMQTRRTVVRGKIVSAVHAEKIGNAHAAVAVSAGSGDLVRALWAEMILALDPRAARRAQRNNRLSQQEIKHSADTSRHDQADDHPDTHTHATPWRIVTDVAHHQHVER